MGRRRAPGLPCSLLLALAAALGLAPTARADDEVGASIVVTARKFSETLQDVPASISAFSARDLQAAGVVDLYGIANRVPALQVWKNIRAVNTGLRLRGIANNPNIPNFDPAVALVVDGVALTRAGLGVDDLVDIARVEVLEGAQSTLYGKSATAGVINVVTREPGRQFAGHLGASQSWLDGGRTAPVWRLETNVGGPLGDNVRAGLAAIAYDQDETTKNLLADGDANSMRRQIVRGQLIVDLGEASLRLIAARSHSEGNSNNPDIDYSTPRNANFVSATACPDSDPDNRTICAVGLYRSRFDSTLASATLTLPLGAATLTAITGYNDYDELMTSGESAQFGRPSYRFHDPQRGHQLSQEIRLSSAAGGTLQWLAGLYLADNYYQEGDGRKHAIYTVDDAIAGSPAGSTSYLDSDSRTRSSAVFAQLLWRASERLSLGGGLRWQRDHVDASMNNDFIGTGFVATQTPTSVNGDYAHRTRHLTHDASLQYRLGAAAMLYLNHASGYKPGGFNIRFGPAPRADRFYDDETVNHVEAGIKSTLLDGALRLNAAAYHDRYRDFQNTGYVGGRFLVNNAERVVSRGLQFDGDWRLSPRWDASGALSLGRTYYDKYLNGACAYLQVPDNGASCTASGKDLPQAPRRQARIGVRYAAPVAVGEFYAALNWRWSSGYRTNSNLDPRTRQDAFDLVDLRLGLRRARHYDVALWANNLFDKTWVMEDGVTNRLGATASAYQRYLGAPRQVGVSLRYDF